MRTPEAIITKACLHPKASVPLPAPYSRTGPHCGYTVGLSSTVLSHWGLQSSCLHWDIPALHPWSVTPILCLAWKELLIFQFACLCMCYYFSAGLETGVGGPSLFYLEVQAEVGGLMEPLPLLSEPVSVVVLSFTVSELRKLPRLHPAPGKWHIRSCFGFHWLVVIVLGRP